MQVLLLQDVKGLGKAGEVKNVADGYARNYLIPRQLATQATAGALRQVDEIKKAARTKQARAEQEAEELAQEIEQITLSFTAKAGESGKLYGSITAGHVAEALAEKLGMEVDKRKIQLEEPLKELGEHTVPIKLSPKVTGAIRVIIEPEES